MYWQVVGIKIWQNEFNILIIIDILDRFTVMVTGTSDMISAGGHDSRVKVNRVFIEIFDSACVGLIRNSALPC